MSFDSLNQPKIDKMTSKLQYGADKRLNSRSSGGFGGSFAQKTKAEKLALQFASGLAHEIRNPLGNIHLAVEMIEAINADKGQRIYLDIIMRSTERINKVIADLLTSTIVHEVEMEEESVHDLLDEVLFIMKDRILLKNIEVRKDYCSGNCIIKINRAQVIIAITNIVINAIDAMDESNGLLILVTSSIHEICIVEISDNGIGIPEENIKNIFIPLFTSKPTGMGFGLSTSKELLDYNGAEICVTSKTGDGTRFIVFFEQSAV